MMKQSATLLPWKKVDSGSVCVRCTHMPNVIRPVVRIDRDSCIIYYASIWGEVPSDFYGMTIARSLTLAGVKKKADAWLRKQGYTLIEENMLVLL
jgi:hypothetical protein